MTDTTQRDELREQNTSRELYRETGDPAGDVYAPSVHVTADGHISMNVGGNVVTLPIAEWHALAWPTGECPDDPKCENVSHARNCDTTEKTMSSEDSAGVLHWSLPRVNTVRSAFSDWGIFPSGDRRGVTGISVRFGHRGVALHWKGER